MSDPIILHSTFRYEMPDPEDWGSVYDTCDSLGPWKSLNPTEKLSALHELDWRGVADDDKRQIIEREVDLSRVSDSDRKRYFGDVLAKQPHAEPTLVIDAGRTKYQPRSDKRGMHH